MLCSIPNCLFKSHYPAEYMAGVLNHAGAIEKITFFMEECKRMGLKFLAPILMNQRKDLQ
jgi:DNA polymerase-3 subunit alpha